MIALTVRHILGIDMADGIMAMITLAVASLAETVEAEKWTRSQRNEQGLLTLLF